MNASLESDESGNYHIIEDVVRKGNQEENPTSFMSEGDGTNWRYELRAVTGFVNEAVPNYHMNNSRDRSCEALLEKKQN